MIREPLTRGVEQRMRNFLIINALEEAKESALLTMNFDIRAVSDRGNPPTDFSSSVGEKRLGRVPLVERMLAVASQLLLFASQRWDPKRVVTIQPPGKLEKLLSVLPRINRFNFRRIHG
jgi:hypothetical protein